MKYLPQTIGERKAYNFLGIKQQESEFELVTAMQFSPKLNGEESGMALIQKDNNYILFDVKREDNENVLQLVIKKPDEPAYIKKDLVLEKKTKQIELKVYQIGIIMYITVINPMTSGFLLIHLQDILISEDIQVLI